MPSYILKIFYTRDDNGNGISEALVIWRFTCLKEASRNGVVVGTPIPKEIGSRAWKKL